MAWRLQLQDGSRWHLRASEAGDCIVDFMVIILRVSLPASSASGASGSSSSPLLPASSAAWSSSPAASPASSSSRSRLAPSLASSSVWVLVWAVEARPVLAASRCKKSSAFVLGPAAPEAESGDESRWHRGLCVRCAGPDAQLFYPGREQSIPLRRLRGLGITHH